MESENKLKENLIECARLREGLEMKCDMLQSANIGRNQIMRCQKSHFSPEFALKFLLYWQFCKWFSVVCLPHLWLSARQWRNCSKPSPLPVALKLSWWTCKSGIFFWRRSWQNKLHSTERRPPFAGSWKTSGLWPRVTSRRRHRTTDNVSRAKQSWRASRPFCPYCIYERWGRTWTQYHIVVLASVSTCLFSFSQCLTYEMLHHRCICWHSFFFIILIISGSWRFPLHQALFTASCGLLGNTAPSESKAR